MTKLLALTILFVMTGCNAQRLCITRIEIRNTCTIPVRVALENYTNLSGDNLYLMVIEPGETSVAGEIVGFSCDLNSSLKSGYKITFDTDNSHKVIGHSEIVDSVVSNRAKSTRDQRYWLLDTKNYCQ